jgi:dipeptide/tripeptide permease
MIVIMVYAGFSLAQSKEKKSKVISGVAIIGALAVLAYKYLNISPEGITLSAPIFQQFNPFYVVALTPVSMAIFGALAKKGKEPSAPRKIAYGMLVAAIGFGIMAFGSQDLNTPNEQAKAIAVAQADNIAEKTIAAGTDEAKLKEVNKMKEDFEGKITKENKELFTKAFDANMTILAGTDSTAVVAATETLKAIKSETKPETRTSPYWLIFTYLILTFAELLLSPMGISFVSKVAPPKYKGMMMGGWFVATAIGNLLVSVGGFLWAGLPLWSVWTVFIVLCLLSALFMFVMMKKLENATK